jgi:hypothetical protein
VNATPRTTRVSMLQFEQQAHETKVGRIRKSFMSMRPTRRRKSRPKGSIKLRGANGRRRELVIWRREMA